MQRFKVVNCPTADLAKTNRAIVSDRDTFAKFEHIGVRYPGRDEAFVFTITAHERINPGEMAFNMPGRKWASLMVGSDVEAAPYRFDVDSQSLFTVKFSVDFVSRQNAPKNIDFDTEDMSKQFNQLFRNQALTVGQPLGFSYLYGGKSSVTFELKVEEMQAISYSQNPSDDTSTAKVEIGLTLPDTVYFFEQAEGAEIRLTGKLSNTTTAPNIFQQNWDFSALGIGGLDDQFKHIFRRAFASRLLPPQLAQKINVEQVRGILLHGPPGTGKTLIARQIGNLLLAREPKVVNGPEILNKYVGESEANIRKLFAEAEEELAKSGINSGLHMIIFDEIDAICKQRGSNPSSAGVGDNVVNQLLSKIDGVNALPNVLLIGMTNRVDLIDSALLRPGRFEVQIEIGLPNKQGRRQILDIHTKKKRDAGVMDPNVDLDELAELTKNYTGAEIAGLVKAAMSRAINRVVTIEKQVAIDEQEYNNIRITRLDFLEAMKEDMKPAFCKSDNHLERLARPMISYDSRFDIIQNELGKIIELAKQDNSSKPYMVLLRGQRRAGLTTIAANMAKQTGFPFIHVYDNKSNNSEGEMSKITRFEKLIQDASLSEFSCIVIDDLEITMGYHKIGPTFWRNFFNNFIAQKDHLLPEGRKMIIICTCKQSEFVDQMDLSSFFRKIVDIPNIRKLQQVETFIRRSIELGFCHLALEEVDNLINAISTIPFAIGVKTLDEIIRMDVPLERPENRAGKFFEIIESCNI